MGDGQFPPESGELEFRCAGCGENVHVITESRCLEDATQLKCPICGVNNRIDIEVLGEKGDG